MEDRWTRYLFEIHSEATLRSWAKRLQFFRFFRAYGGHANDGDSLDVAFRYAGIQQLEGFLDALGVKLTKHSVKPPQPEQGKSYSGEVFSKFPSLIPGTAWIEQPGHSQIAGTKIFIWCGEGEVKISVGENYTICEEDVVAAVDIERELAGLNLQRIDPPSDSKHYICPKYYPEFFID